MMVALIKEEERTIEIEEKVEEGTTTMMVGVSNSFSHLNLNRIILQSILLNLGVRISIMTNLFARFVERQVIKLLIATTGWILPIKARIHQPS